MPTVPADSEAGYYQAIEEYFVSRRGDPLLLSNADWTLIHKWRTAGVPLRIVLRGISDALDSHAHSWGRSRKVGSLAYCAAEVDVARERWERALSVGEEPEADPADLLYRLAEAIEGCAPLRDREAARALAGALRDPSRGAEPRRALETWLMAREAEVVEWLGEASGPEWLPAIEREVDADLAGYRGRMPDKVLAQVRSESIARRAMSSHGLPRFSLFHL
jgi:hypothetical protein